jgi:hypothetical protein
VSSHTRLDKAQAYGNLGKEEPQANQPTPITTAVNAAAIPHTLKGIEHQPANME